MTETQDETIVIDVPTTGQEPPLLHIVKFDDNGAPRDVALCGAKVTRLFLSGRSECKECIRIRMSIDNGKGWWKPLKE